MILVTTHTLSHWERRCRQWAPPRHPADPGRTDAKKHVRRVVEAGRMATDDEARAFSLWLHKARYAGQKVARPFAPGDCIVSEPHGVIFALRFDGDLVLVVTAVPLATARKYAAALPARRPKKPVRQEV